MGGLTRRATVHGVGSIPLQTTVNVRWTRELAEVMRPFTTGSDYVNEIKPMRGGAHQGRLPGELRAARGSEEQVRPTPRILSWQCRDRA